MTAKQRILGGLGQREITLLEVELCTRANLMMVDLMRAGLYETGHKMHEVVRNLGYEIANNREKRWKKEKAAP